MDEDIIQYVTQKGYNDLVAEILDLKENKIPEIAKRIDEAKQQGDLSENAEYHSAKDEMIWTQGRLSELKKVIENAKVIDNVINNSSINLGSTVNFKTNKGENEYTIVGPQEADPKNGKISNESPIGKAFLGCKSGDKIKVETPAGVIEYTIISIK